MHAATYAWWRPGFYAGNNNEARMAMLGISTRSSISVKPLDDRVLVRGDWCRILSSSQQQGRSKCHEDAGCWLGNRLSQAAIECGQRESVCLQVFVVQVIPVEIQCDVVEQFERVHVQGLVAGETVVVRVVRELDALRIRSGSE